MKNDWKEKSDQALGKAGNMLSSAVSRVRELGQEYGPDAEDVRHAKDWVKKTASATADEATRLGKEAMKSDMVKDAATGAGLGAAIAVPIPLVGPVAGAVVGAGLGIYKNLNRAAAPGAQPPQLTAAPSAPTAAPPSSAPIKDLYGDLLKLDDLRQRNILTQEEFDVQKKKLLDAS